MEPNEHRVVFETEGVMSHFPERPKRISGMARFVIKLTGGLASNEKQANYVLIVFVLVTFIFSYLLTFSLSRELPEIIKDRDNISPEVRAQLPPGVWETIPSKFK